MNHNIVNVAFPASCGELVQGIVGNKRFVCSYAIDCFTYITVRINEHLDEPLTLPKKSAKAVELVKEMSGGVSNDLWDQLDIQIDNRIPYEKGMGSSTADLAALSIALFELFEIPWTPQIIIQLLTRIEATDSIVYPELSMMNPDTGEKMAYFKQDQYYAVACLIPEENIYTQGIISKYAERKDNQLAYEDLFKQSLVAFEHSSIDELINVAEISAMLNESIVTKPYLKALLKLSRHEGIKGLNISHTGTVIGIIYDDATISKNCVSQLVRTIDSEEYYQIQHYKMILAQPIIEKVLLRERR